ncbi:IS3 family transposase, partial [Vibrio splendidus]
QAFYKRCVAEIHQTKKDESILGFVKEQRMMHPRIGTRKIKYLLAQNDIKIGRDRLFSLLRMNRLLVQNRRAY